MWKTLLLVNRTFFRGFLFGLGLVCFSYHPVHAFCDSCEFSSTRRCDMVPYGPGWESRVCTPIFGCGSQISGSICCQVFKPAPICQMRACPSITRGDCDSECSIWLTVLSCCGNKICEPGAFEDSKSCAADCPPDPGSPEPPCSDRGATCGGGELCCQGLTCGMDAGQLTCQKCLLGADGCCTTAADCTPRPGGTAMCCSGSRMCASSNGGPYCGGGAGCTSNADCSSGCCDTSSGICGTCPSTCSDDDMTCNANIDCCHANCPIPQGGSGSKKCCPAGQVNCRGSCVWPPCDPLCTKNRNETCTAQNECCTGKCTGGLCCNAGEVNCNGNCAAVCNPCTKQLGQGCAIATDCCTGTCTVGTGPNLCCDPNERNCNGCMIPKADEETCASNCQCKSNNCSDMGLPPPATGHCCGISEHYSTKRCCPNGQEYCDLSNTCVPLPNNFNQTCNCTGHIRCDGTCSVGNLACPSCGDLCGTVLAAENPALPLKNLPIQLRDTSGKIRKTTTTGADGKYLFQSVGTAQWYVVPALGRLQSSDPGQLAAKIPQTTATPGTIKIRGIPATVHVTGTPGSLVILSANPINGNVPPRIDQTQGVTQLAISGVISADGKVDINVPSGAYYSKCWKPLSTGGYANPVNGTPPHTDPLDPQVSQCPPACVTCP
jgi:hypothetical protein